MDAVATHELVAAPRITPEALDVVPVNRGARVARHKGAFMLITARPPWQVRKGGGCVFLALVALTRMGHATPDKLTCREEIFAHCLGITYGSHLSLKVVLALDLFLSTPDRTPAATPSPFFVAKLTFCQSMGSTTTLWHASARSSAIKLVRLRVKVPSGFCPHVTSASSQMCE